MKIRFPTTLIGILSINSCEKAKMLVKDNAMTRKIFFIWAMLCTTSSACVVAVLNCYGIYALLWPG